MLNYHITGTLAGKSIDKSFSGHTHEEVVDAVKAHVVSLLKWPYKQIVKGMGRDKFMAEAINRYNKEYKTSFVCPKTALGFIELAKTLDGITVTEVVQ